MARKPLYVLPGANPGLLIRGNIDINNRTAVKNTIVGGTSTVWSMSFGTTIDGRNVEVLVPRVVNGRVVSVQQAIRAFDKTGKHLGIFDTPAHANAYAKRLHIQQAQLGKASRFQKATRP